MKRVKTLEYRTFVLQNHKETAVIFLTAHPASFTHNFVSGMQHFYFSESQDAMVLQTCHEKKCSGLIGLQLDPLILETASPRLFPTYFENPTYLSIHL